jgi:DNA-directed RNA polymerase specialized sigma24 family protein
MSSIPRIEAWPMSPGSVTHWISLLKAGQNDAAQVAEEYRRLVAALPKQELRQIAQWKMEGDTNDEIAAKLKCALRTVERRLELIRSLWEGEVFDHG